MNKQLEDLSMKKILNEAKADAIAIYNALDIASGGNLSLIKQSIAQSFQGFLEVKFKNIVLDVLSNDINEDELIEFIHSQSNSNKEFISNLILKNMHADNRITTFLLAKLWIQKMRNGSLNYYEASLFANINTLTFDDFKIFYETIQTLSPKEDGMFNFQTNSTNEYYATALEKFKQIGILLQSSNLTIPDQFPVVDFQKSIYCEILMDHLNEYFESYIKN